VSSPTASNRTIIIALGANFGIAISKFIAAGITGSSAMLTEGVHSVVDCTNQLLLLWGRRQANKPADEYHPFGYGRELYFWSFVVAVLVFALGAGVSIYEGILHIAEPEHAGSPTVAYVVLLIAFLLDGWSTMEAFREFKEAKGNSGWIDAIRRSKDPAGFIVLLENGAAMAGIVVAAAGLALAQATADPFYDGAASVVIGLILGITAFFLAYESKALLIGEAADPEIVRALHEMVEARDGVSSVGEVLTVHSAPDQITAMLSVDFVDTMTAREVEALVCSVELEAEKRFPIIRRLYIRPRSPADQGPCS
jgi:cation diffusion facilitator family transporter